MTKAPVCKVEVDEKNVAAKAEYKGKAITSVTSFAKTLSIKRLRSI